MSRRRRIAYIILVIAGALTILGFFAFVIGIMIEYFGIQQEGQFSPDLSPAIQFALAGLCLSTFMFALWFVIVGLLLARQTRRSGSGYGYAYRLMETFRFGEAIPILERSIKEGKENSEILTLLTTAYAFTGQLAKAQATADRAVQLYPDDPGSYVTLANGYRLQAAYDEAAEALKIALQHSPDQAVLWAELGFVQRFAGEEEKAFESFERASKHIMPAMYSVRVYYHLATTYRKINDMEKAEQSTKRMITAREGLLVWKTGLNALRGTAYGSALHYEIDGIEKAIASAEANLQE